VRIGKRCRFCVKLDRSDAVSGERGSTRSRASHAPSAKGLERQSQTCFCMVITLPCQAMFAPIVPD
jgi:hypothetical protein